MKIKILLSIMCGLLFFNSCTDDFEEANSHPYQIKDESLKQDFQHIGSKFQPILMTVVTHNYQIGQNLASDSWVRYLGNPTPFVSGANNCTYKMTWKDAFWNKVYQDVMGPADIVIKTATEDEAPMYVYWARLVKVMAISKLTTLHGPVMYSEFGKSTGTVHYDSEEELYPKLFKELDDIKAKFVENTAYTGFEKFDYSPYKGDVLSWIRMINSLRLRLAIRISNVSPDLAKVEAEKAITSEEGIILSNAQNLSISLFGGKHPLKVISNEWGDTRMSASMESILCGYKDGRLSKYFVTATDDKLKYTNHTSVKYKGIRCGAELDAKDTRTGFSKVGKYFVSEVTHIDFIRSSEMYFCLAEAALRGWNVEKSAKEYYEKGIRESFSRWKADGVDDYILDNTSLPLDYDDEKADGAVNDFTNKIQITVKWDDAATNEVKLERIMTQKWIAGFPNSFEPWADFRRTGYPKLPYNYKNDSNEEDGVIAKDDFIKRMKFPESEEEKNEEGYNAAVKMLKGPDKISTRLWFDTGSPNF
jgi:hypothetical protein